jgi:hypothetical protein
MFWFDSESSLRTRLVWQYERHKLCHYLRSEIFEEDPASQSHLVLAMHNYVHDSHKILWKDAGSMPASSTSSSAEHVPACSFIGAFPGNRQRAKP